MQTLARVDRTFEGKPSGLLVAYAPLADNLNKALAEYTDTDRATKPVGKDLDEAVALTTSLLTQLDEVCAGYDWRSQLDGGPKSWIKATAGLANYLRSPTTPGNKVEEGEKTLQSKFREFANQLARAWALCSGNGNTADTLRARGLLHRDTRDR